MEKEQTKDKIYEMTLSGNGIEGKIKLQNSNNRVIAKIGDILIDKLSYFKWNNSVKFLDKYLEQKKQRNLEGKETPLPPKFIMEILDNAFIEEDENLQEIWAQLLINWQDPEKVLDRKYMYIDILKNMSPIEVKMLEIISHSVDYNEVKNNENSYYCKDSVLKCIPMSDNEYEIMMLNLFRLGCCESHRIPNSGVMMGNMPIIPNLGTKQFRITALGYNLIESCIKK